MGDLYNIPVTCIPTRPAHHAGGHGHNVRARLSGKIETGMH